MIVNTSNGKEYPLWRYAVLYSELEGSLHKLRAKYPMNMRVETIGKSHEGRDLFLVILAKDVTDEKMKAYEAFRQKTLWQPDQIIDDIEKGESYQIPLFFNCNLHGTEISGTDGMLDFIDEILGSEQQKVVLEDAVILITICANPDGRSKGLDILNGHGMDLNRDFAAQTQPETKAIVRHVITRFSPSIMVDFHGYMSSGNVLIDTCTPPHNPNTEYDLLEGHLLKNALKMAEVIDARLRLKTDIASQLWEDGWEDYSPIYTPTYCHNFGCIAHTLETTYPNEEGAAVTLCTAIGALQYAAQHKNELLINQCTYFLRGLTNTSKALKGPAYYVIPFDRAAQRDRGVTKDTLEKLLMMGIKVYRSKTSGSYVIPTAQPLRGLIHNFLWQGEQVTDKAENMYDVSFYSYPIMRGFDIQELDALDEDIVEVERIEEVLGLLEMDSAKPFLSFSSQANDAMKFVNALIKQGVDVYRASQSYEGGEAGDFFFENAGSYHWLEQFVNSHDLHVKPAELPEGTHRIKNSKILLVADSGGAYEVLTDWGFDVTLLPFYELNNGYAINPADYDVLLFGGTRLGLWSDPFEEFMGVGYGNSWALRGRGRQTIIEAAPKFANAILFGYAGIMLNNMTGIVNQGHLARKPEEEGSQGENQADWHLNTGSGSFKLKLDNSDPLCYGYDHEQTVYVVGPIGLGKTRDLKAPGYFAENAFINGWCKNQGELSGKPALQYEKSSKGTKVLMGIDPCFRKYVDSTFRLMANALLLTGYECDYKTRSGE